MKSVIDNVVQLNLTRYPSDQEHTCPYCKCIVEKTEIEILGVKRIVQPSCKCETNAHAEEMRKFTEYDKRREVEKRFAISSVGKRFEESTFENFVMRQGAETAYKQSRKYVLEFDECEVSLLLWGTYGNGKSRLAAAVASGLKQKGKTVVFQSVPELLERIRQTFNKNNTETEQQIMSALLHCDLLILDDIGAEKVTDWVSDALYRIIDGRYRKKLHTMYTSNLKPSELEGKLGGRIYDRILETTNPIENKASSYRMEQAKVRFAKLRAETE